MSSTDPTVTTPSLPTSVPESTPQPTPTESSPPPTPPAPSSSPPPSPPPPTSSPPSEEPSSPPSPSPPSSDESEPSSDPTSSSRPTPSSQSNIIVTLTSTTDPTTITGNPRPTDNAPLTTTSRFSALPTTSSDTGSGGGLSAGGTIAVAVVVPVVSVALIIVALLIFWRRRKAKKLAEEERKQEIEEYRYNPNADPALPAVGLTGPYDDGSGPDDVSAGYRGWGATQTSRKLSTNLSSAPESHPAYGHGRVSPIDDTLQYTEDNRPVSRQSDPPAGLQAMPIATGHPPDIRRGISNASSAYSTAQLSDSSDDAVQGAPLGSQYYEDHGRPQPNAYGEMTYGGPQPVIRDVQARRNTRIETPTVVPQHGNAGIAQNF